ncbi:MAG: hypothetical protein C4576_16615, partial [Desulfobacteraceae bacterium]
GFFLSWLFYKLLKRVKVDETMREKLKQLQKQGTVVYAIKYRGQLDYLMYHYYFRANRFPAPKLAFDVNVSLLLPVTRFLKVYSSRFSSFFRTGAFPDPYDSGVYRNAIVNGTTSLLFLVDEKGFMQHFIQFGKDRLEFLMEVQRELDRPIFLVPLLTLYRQGPERENPTFQDVLFRFKDHPGAISKIILFFRHHRQALIDFGEPINLKEYCMESHPPEHSPNRLAQDLRNRLIGRIDNQKRVVLGPIMKSRQQFKETVLQDPALTRKIESKSAGKRETLKRIRRQAGAFFDEIAADYSIVYVHGLISIFRWFMKRVFEGIEVDHAGMAKVREWARKGPVIYVPSHKSHIDYLVLNYVLHEHYTHIPRIAAGQNLAFWPMGHIFRKCGAFFIRRSFRDPLYVEVFNRYIKALLEDGHPIEFFIEGGRSRNGKLVFPKKGFLSILLQAHKEGYCEDLIFVPAAIAYDRVLEENAYLKEIAGEKKEKENFRQILKARGFLKRSYGKIHIRFAPPFSLKEYLSQRPGASPQEIRQSLALELVQAINSVTPLTPLSLLATAILANHRRGFFSSELLATVKTLMVFLRKRGILITPSLSDVERATNETLALLLKWRILESIQDEQSTEEPFYYLDEEKKVQLEYYKNSIIHYMIGHAFAAISLLSGKEEEKEQASLASDFDFLMDLFRNEFVFDQSKDTGSSILEIMEFFIEEGYVSRNDMVHSYRITKLGYEKLPIWAALAKTFVESYWIAVRSAGSKMADGKPEEGVKHAMVLGRRLYKSGAVDHIGALSPLNFQNAFTVLHKHLHGRTSGTESEAPERLAKLGQRLYAMAHYGRS